MHMVQHMTMSMLAPMFLVLGGPFTLALRALKPSTTGRWGLREWIVWGLHSPAAKIVTNPFFVFAVFSLSMFALYFTPLMAWLMVQRDLARQAGQADEVARIQRRIAVVLGKGVP